MPSATRAFAATGPTTPLGATSVSRRDPLASDVEIEILFCGVCHSDLHQARNEWNNTVYPCVPGHEIVGRVTRTGASVSKFKKGDIAAVGCLVDSCRECPSCREVTEEFVLRIDPKLDPAGAAPLLCAGITTYSPLREWDINKGSRVGVVGLGGLGHMGVKIAHALGAHVTLYTTSANKAEDAKRMGASDVVISKDPAQMARNAGKQDFILNTVSAPHDINAMLGQLRRDGTMCMVGAPDKPHPPVDVFGMIFGRRRMSGSLIGGIKETQEMLDFCAKHNIVSDIEIIPIQKINEAYERMLKSDVKYRFVIDMASLKG